MSFERVIFIEDLARILFSYIEGEGLSGNGLGGCCKATYAAALQCVRKAKISPLARPIATRRLLIRFRDSPDLKTLSVGGLRVNGCPKDTPVVIVPDGIAQLPQLECLRVTSLAKDQLDVRSFRPCAKLSNLCMLDISHCNVKNLTGLNYMRNLRVLDASNNLIPLHPFLELSACSKLKELYLSHNRMERVDLSQLPRNLEVLVMSEQRCHQTLLSGAMQPNNLKCIDAHKTNLRIVDGLGNLPHLEELNLAETSISLFNFSGMEKLEIVNLSGNMFRNIPNMSSLKRLREFRLRRNGHPLLIPEWFGPSFANSLQILDMTSTDVNSEIPESFQQLEQLSSLVFDQQVLASAPSWFGTFLENIRKRKPS